MRCEDCDALLIDHAHGELDPPTRAAVTRHLASCPTCAVAFCRLRADLDGVLQATAEAPPPAVRARLRAEVERSFRPTWRRRAWTAFARPVPAYAVLAALAVPAVMWLVVTTRGPERTPETGPPRLSGYDAAAPLLTERPIL